jgi:hypothetical protein
VNRVFAYLARFAIILFGYAVAALAASAFLNVVMLASLDMMTPETSAIATGSLFVSVPFIALFVAYFSFIPSAFAILAGEVFGMRGWLFYALGGAAVAAILVGFIGVTAETGGETMADANFLLTLVGSGMFGGIGYWLIAGRTAGSWRMRDAQAPAISPAP